MGNCLRLQTERLMVVTDDLRKVLVFNEIMRYTIV